MSQPMWGGCSQQGLSWGGCSQQGLSWGGLVHFTFRFFSMIVTFLRRDMLLYEKIIHAKFQLNRLIFDPPPEGLKFEPANALGRAAIGQHNVLI